MRAAPIAIGLALAAICTAGCLVRRGGRDRGDAENCTGPASDTVTGPGVVLICLDTLRADSLSLDSGRPVHMPRLEAFARQSVAFADAVAPAAWTGPSITSLLTGLDPSHTGVMGLPERTGDLSDSVLTLAQRVVVTGRHTAAVTSGLWLVPGTSALRGSTYGGFGLDADPEGVLETWNAARPKGVPFLLFLHALAAHDPYLDKVDAGPPSPDRKFSAADETRARAIRVAIERGGAFSYDDIRWSVEACVRSQTTRERLGLILGRPAFEKLFGIQRRWLDDECERDPLVATLGERLRAAYVEGLSSVDRMFGRMEDALTALHLPEDTIVVVVADHGEAFGEHGTLLHGRRLHDEMVRVPMLVRAPGRMGAARVVRGDAGLIDVVPTVLELMGVARPAGLDGISLVPSIAGATPLPERAMRAYEERYHYENNQALIERLESIRTTRAKCLVTRRAADRRITDAVIYDLLVDPHEAHPIPLEAVDQPCEFGDGFAAALEDAGFTLPHRAAATARPTVKGGSAGG